jgi:hypothetical protein
MINLLKKMKEDGAYASGWFLKSRLLSDERIVELLGENPGSEWNIQDTSLTVDDNISLGMATALQALCWSFEHNGLTIWEPNGDAEPYVIGWDAIVKDAASREHPGYAEEIAARFREVAEKIEASCGTP